MIAESTRQLLSPVNQYLPKVWIFLISVLAFYIIYSITTAILRFLWRKIKHKAKSRDCSFSWITYGECIDVARMYKKEENKKGIGFDPGINSRRK